ncbi:nucleoside-diphosphate kinase [Candidatus Gottesmanbacteria bacterium RIFCSPLOWO2_02_FULL_42_29]|uniref:Nucleoside diphosphate kinase n=2 Tax=Candidatus Gottesmaniibacteriota TaxID=1752720 RepID=A0A1F6BJS1_9BACT|nr:MAG: Nucleoside diphosphate kinase [Candidatus Gottesmanbacteria bacterium GW2011_GWA2_42_18]KKS75042.1 MAG: Nucleoside diphosphate kinase [Candidatus Gottesmanbacteria bacterium GW2011_GWC2_42_8]OGG09705.1 MAG: nucleoside-diphosphate kinase [Candidatus Gottesmanbacteria bacterium RIFCSPHIGHO2_01_FULL_42_27]OGG22519.1 MAG: nucleoside-diphosphate kinase [Candidatus Gottesmanbacteria bacterium RIFCSPHIGHO2_12_FULL_43_26]OGG34889.1 MAG: nucleoside-diphosphate kinase [Candidatus Gottesmanbacteri
MERTVVLIKPDAVSKGFIGKIIARFEKEDFLLIAAKFMRLPDDLLDDWYEHHKEKPFFAELKSFMISTPIMAMLWEGKDAIKRVRKLCGPTDATKAPKGTIRGDYGEDVQRNAIHASEDDHAASKEMDLIFLPHEIQEWKR